MANNVHYGPDIKARVFDVILLPLSWVGSTSPFTYTISTITNVNPTSIVHIIPSINITSEEYTAYINANLIDGGIVNNTVTVKSVGAKPTINIPVRIIVSNSIFVESKYELSTYPVANETEVGLLRLATNEEINTGLDNTIAVSPLGLYNNYLKLTGGTLTGQLNGTTITASSFVGNASTATKLATTRNITLTGGVTGTASFDGSANVLLTTTIANNSHTHTGDNITSKVASSTLSDSTNSIAGISVYTGTTNPTGTTRVNINGYLYATRIYSDLTGNVSGSSGSCTGNSATATKLITPRSISLTGAVTGSGSFDGNSNITISTDMNYTLPHVVSWTMHDSNQTWCRTWSNGWKEQGGLINITTYSLVLKSYPVAFTSAPLKVHCEPYNQPTSTSSDRNYLVNLVSITNTSFKVRYYDSDDTSYRTGWVSWEACGF